MKIKDENVEVSLGSYIRSKPGSIIDEKIAQIADHYKKNIAQKLIPLHPQELIDIKNHTSKSKLGDELFVSVKVDGESTVLIYDEQDSDYKSYFCNASTHRVWVGLPVNKDLEQIFQSKGIKHAYIPGELYAAPEDPPNFDARARVFDFIHCSRNPSGQNDIDRIGFRAFDLIEVSEEKWIDKPFAERYKKLKSIFPESGRASVVRSQILKDTQLAEFFDQVVTDGGAEGLVIRNSESFRNYKVKPVHTIDVAIIGAVSGIEGSQLGPDQLASTLLSLRYPDGTFQILTSAGSGLTAQQRKELWLKMEFVKHSGYVAATSDGRAFRMVKPQYVGQIEYLDILTTNLNNLPNMQSTLIYNDVDNTWELLRPLPFVKMLSPRYYGENPIRDDKRPTVEDVRVSQITDYVDLDPINAVKRVDLPKSEIAARYVFEKGENIRKFVAWKTNKNKVDPAYPNYVIYMTDYSKDRASPLDRKVKVTNDDSQFWQLIDEWIKDEMYDNTGEGLKRGWNLFTQMDTRSNPLEIPTKDGKPKAKKGAKKTAAKKSAKTTEE